MVVPKLIQTRAVLSTRIQRLSTKTISSIDRYAFQKSSLKGPKLSSIQPLPNFQIRIWKQDLSFVQKNPPLITSLVLKPTQTPTLSTRPISFFKKNVEKEEQQAAALYKTFEWLCKIKDWISFALTAQMVVCAVGGLVLLGGTAAVGYLVNPNFSVALVPEALIGVVAAHATYQLKEDVDNVGDALELIKSLFEPPIEGEETGFTAQVIKQAFAKLKEAMLSSVKMMIVGPPIGSILVGVTGFFTGSYFLTSIGAANATAQTVVAVATAGCGLMAVGGVPALVICYAIYKRLRTRIVGVLDNMEAKFLAKAPSD